MIADRSRSKLRKLRMEKKVFSLQYQIHAAGEGCHAACFLEMLLRSNDMGDGPQRGIPLRTEGHKFVSKSCESLGKTQ